MDRAVAERGKSGDARRSATGTKAVCWGRSVPLTVTGTRKVAVGKQACEMTAPIQGISVYSIALAQSH